VMKDLFFACFRGGGEFP